MPTTNTNEKILSLLETLAQDTKVWAEATKIGAQEMGRLRDLRHKDGDHLQNVAISTAEIRDTFTAQAKAFDEFKIEIKEERSQFRKENHEEREAVRKEIKDVKDIIVGPGDDPKKGIVFQVMKFQTTVEGIHRLLWLIVAGCITMCFGVATALIIAYARGKI